MASHDTIGDFLTIIRNASAAKKATCIAQWSHMRESIARILCDEGFVSSFKLSDQGPGKKAIELTLKYVEGVAALTGLQRHSRPGCRLYCGSLSIPRVLGGLGIAIITTSKGVMKDADARRQKLGGELIAKVW